ncbi:MAG: radical SAM-associated putative lipoprotein [Bacteroidia bacterium]|nr:radical SAM-associated putative lipoprotein [Bacteroidia bacterium]
MKNQKIRVKDYLLRKILKNAGFAFGFGSISLLTMCCKYGDIADITGTIKGKVTSSGSGEAIKDIEISIKENSRTIKTDNTGNYVVEYLEPQQYTVEAKDIDGADNGEFQNSTKTVELLPNELENCDFVLNPK